MTIPTLILAVLILALVIGICLTGPAITKSLIRTYRGRGQ